MCRSCLSLSSQGCYKKKKIAILDQYSRGIDDLLRRPMAMEGMRVVLSGRSYNTYFKMELE